MNQSLYLENNRFLTSQDIFHILRNPNARYYIHKHPTLVHILSQNNPFHASPSNFLKIRFNIILPSHIPCAKSQVPFLLFVSC
jgi:hypothetical protein